MRHILVLGIFFIASLTSCEKEDTTPTTPTAPSTPTYTQMGIDQVGGIYKAGEEMKITIPGKIETIFDKNYNIELKYLGNGKVKMIINTSTYLPDSIKTKEYFIHKGSESSALSQYYLTKDSATSSYINGVYYGYGIPIMMQKFSNSILSSLVFSINENGYKVEVGKAYR